MRTFQLFVPLSTIGQVQASSSAEQRCYRYGRIGAGLVLHTLIAPTLLLFLITGVNQRYGKKAILFVNKMSFIAKTDKFTTPCDERF